MPDVRHFAENAVRRKLSHAPTLTQTKCMYRVHSLYGINLRIMRTESKMVVDTVAAVSSDEVSSTKYGIWHISPVLNVSAILIVATQKKNK